MADFAPSSVIPSSGGNIGMEPLLDNLKLDDKNLQVGKEKRALGYRPHFPIILIPGFASSSLEAWETPEESWYRERVWVSVSKLSKKIFLDPTQTVKSAFNSVKNKVRSRSSSLDSSHQEAPSLLNANEEETWVKHISLKSDGFSDPEGIKLRPMDGLRGVDHLNRSKPHKTRTTVFGKLIKNLADIGYDSNNLNASPYDWRLSPIHLQERDGYFTKLKYQISVLRKTNGNRVILICHSMGYKVLQYFLWWIHKRHPTWIAKNIENVIGVGAPCLGAPRLLRSVITGWRNGLELFLKKDEMKYMTRSFGSVPLLFPHGSSYTFNLRENEHGRRKYKRIDMEEALKLSGAHQTWNYFTEYYEKDDLYLGSLSKQEPFAKQQKESPDVLEIDGVNWDYVLLDSLEQYDQIPLTLKPPPVPKLTLIYGVGLDTEVSYIFKSKSEGKLHLDRKGDKLPSNGGYFSKGGIIYETEKTSQRIFNFLRASDNNPSDTIREESVQRSGDGSVPYSSLNFYQRFCGRYGTDPLIPEIQMIEVPGAEHRMLLQDQTFLNLVIDMVSKRQPSGDMNSSPESQ
eukprot:TRINITY_DN7021_c0_g2_i3.p1 TRINITY_DN7021_c0_g2~~TRINITY_DN7021_c0_g2_i3.p1  ORF type:complete len:571 (+),score=146.57 TRINITY_DN7021_c0_g2_i3:329-2041(+)